MTQERTAEIKFELLTVDATEACGAIFAAVMFRPLLLTLSGDLGAGKTTFTRGFLRARGYGGAVKSPTFTLVESYDYRELNLLDERQAGKNQPGGLHHFDLYRIAEPAELDFIGFEEYLADNFDVLVEWPENGADRLTMVDFAVRLTHCDQHREAHVEALSPEAEKWLFEQENNNKFIGL
ncbi:MAG: tRNA (adenosine(37)-N6)-threonylcarbamoyltransferase complex ATPase subunit type 1 TsaE [Pseudomonadota bacterium]